MDELFRWIRTERNRAEELACETKLWQEENPKNTVYLYGAGYLMQFYLRYLQKYSVKVSAILDSFKEGEYNGIPITCYDAFLRVEPEAEHCRFFISSAAAAREITAQLAQHFPKDHIFFVDHAFQLGIEGMTLDEYRNYLLEKQDEITQLYQSLADEQSKKTLNNALREHITGNPVFLWDTLDPNLDYPEEVICFSDGEVLVEPGANNGNTFLEFVRRCPQYKAAYLFEPEQCFQDRLKEIAEMEAQRGKAVHIIQKGVWEEETELRFLSTGEGNGSFVINSASGNIVSIPVTAIDTAVPEPFTYLKMDIEGSELKALTGARDHIRRHHPKLGISVYHKPTDLLDVWNLLRALVPEYRFYLRNHTPLWDDVILYAVYE